MTLILPTRRGIIGKKRGPAVELVASGFYGATNGTLFAAGALAALGAEAGDILLVGMPYNGTLANPAGGGVITRLTHVWMYNAAVHSSKVLTAADLTAAHTISGQDFGGTAWAIYRGAASATRVVVAQSAHADTTLTIPVPAPHAKHLAFVLYATDRDAPNPPISSAPAGFTLRGSGSTGVFTSQIADAIPSPDDDGFNAVWTGFPNTYMQAGCAWELRAP